MTEDEKTIQTLLGHGHTAYHLTENFALFPQTSCKGLAVKGISRRARAYHPFKDMHFYMSRRRVHSIAFAKSSAELFKHVQGKCERRQVDPAHNSFFFLSYQIQQARFKETGPSRVIVLYWPVLDYDRPTLLEHALEDTSFSQADCVKHLSKKLKVRFTKRDSGSSSILMKLLLSIQARNVEYYTAFVIWTASPKRSPSPQI